MGTTVTAPNVTTSTVTTPPAPPAPQIEQLDGGTLTRNHDGTIEIKAATGEVFKGTPDEVMKSMTKAQVKTHEYAGNLKQQLEAAKQPPAAPVVQATAEEVQLQNYLADQLAKKLGLTSGEELVQNFQQMHNVTSAAGAQMAAASFYAQNPDFPTSGQNIDKLFEVLEKIGGDERNTDHLSAAHAVCLKTGIYKGLTPEEITKLTPQNPTAPPPMIQPSSVETNVPTGVTEVNINMTQEQILAAIKATRAAQK